MIAATSTNPEEGEEMINVEGIYKMRRQWTSMAFFEGLAEKPMVMAA